MRQIKQNNLVKNFPNFPVYVDSPLAIEATNVFKDNLLECYDECVYLKFLGYVTVFACLSCLPHSFITLVVIINYIGLENQY